MNPRVLAALAAVIILGSAATTYAFVSARSSSSAPIRLSVSSALYDLVDASAAGGFYALNVTVIDSSANHFAVNPSGFELVTNASEVYAQPYMYSTSSIPGFVALQSVVLDAGQNASGALLFQIPIDQTARELEYIQPEYANQNLTIATSNFPSPRWLSLVSPAVYLRGNASACISSSWSVPSTYLLSGGSARFNLTFSIADYMGCDTSAPQTSLVSATISPNLSSRILSPSIPVIYSNAGCVSPFVNGNPFEACQGPLSCMNPLRFLGCQESIAFEVMAPNYSAKINLNVALDFEYQG